MTALTRRAVLAAPLVLPAGTLRAQSRFPDRPITIIVPFTAGGSTDIAMRALAEAATRRFGQTVLVENRPGAGSTLGPAAVARARPDGYLLTQLPASAVRVTMLQSMAFDVLRDFTPVIHLTGYLFGLVVPVNARWPNWAAFVAEARANPGKITVGNAGINGSPHVGMLELCARENIEVTHVPYRGEAESTQAMLGGHVDAAATSSLGGVLVTEGRGRWLNIWAAQRSRRWPDTPTLQELGYQGLVISSPYGLVAPPGLDPAVLRSLHDGLKEAMHDASHLAVLDRFDMAPDYKDSAGYAAFLRELVAYERDVVTRLNLRQG